MDGDTRSRPSPESRYERLYRLLVIAAIAVIMVSLVGIASMTGILPRVGEAKPNAGAIQQRPHRDGEKRDTAAPRDKPSLRPVPVHNPHTAGTCEFCIEAWKLTAAGCFCADVRKLTVGDESRRTGRA